MLSNAPVLHRPRHHNPVDGICSSVPVESSIRMRETVKIIDGGRMALGSRVSGKRLSIDQTIIGHTLAP